MLGAGGRRAGMAAFRMAARQQSARSIKQAQRYSAVSVCLSHHMSTTTVLPVMKLQLAGEEPASLGFSSMFDLAETQDSISDIMEATLQECLKLKTEELRQGLKSLDVIVLGVVTSLFITGFCAASIVEQQPVLSIKDKQRFSSTNIQLRTGAFK
eukprot:sb/3473258/